MASGNKLTIINQRELQNKYIEGSVIPIATIKMVMTIEEAAECSGIGRNTMRKLVEWKKIPVLKVGRKTIIRSDTLERFMAANQGRNLLVRDDVRSVE